MLAMRSYGSIGDASIRSQGIAKLPQSKPVPVWLGSQICGNHCELGFYLTKIQLNNLCYSHPVLGYFTVSDMVLVPRFCYIECIDRTRPTHVFDG
jgi:hypothetical protein